MKPGIRIVAPFRPFPPESELHHAYADFDWLGTVKMLVTSAKQACACPVHVITDVDTRLPVATLHYVTTRRRLMLWTLEVTLRYLQSEDFDRHTVVLDCDQLVYRDLAPWCDVEPPADMTVLIRPGAKHQEPGGFPLLNGVQWLSARARPQLISFYTRALLLAETMDESLLQWGADQEALRRLLEPLELGLVERSGLRVRMIHAHDVLETISTRHIEGIQAGQMPWPVRAVLDGRWKRKEWLKPAFEQTLQRQALEVLAC